MQKTNRAGAGTPLGAILSLFLALALAWPLGVAANPPTQAELEERIRQLETENARLQFENQQLMQFIISGGGGGGGGQQPTPPPATPTPSPQVFRPLVHLVSPQSVTVARGETVDLELTLRNIGTHTAFNVLTQATASSGAPFSVEFIGNSNSVAQIRENGTATLTMRVAVDAGADAGPHEINLRHFFRDQARENIDSADRIAVRIASPGQAGEADVRVSSFQTARPGPILPGQSFNASVTVENAGDAAATNIRLSLPGMKPDEVFFLGDLGQAVIQSLPPGQSAELHFTFQVSERFAGGAVPIEFLALWHDANRQNPVEGKFTFFVNIAGGSPPTLEIRNMQMPQGMVRVGQAGEITFELRNTSQTEARNVRIEAAAEGADLVPMGAASIQNFPSIAPGAGLPLMFSFTPRASAITQSYTVNFTVSFLDRPGGERISFSDSAIISVFNPDPEEDDDDNGDRTQIPRIIVSNYVVDPAIPRAGREFDMQITFRNTNTARSINNIRITMEALEGTQDQGAVFTPVGGSNTLFIDFMAPGEEVTKNLRFFTVNDALQRSYNIKVSFEYQCQDYQEFTASENLSVSVAQVVRIETDGLDIPQNSSVGDSIWVRFNVLNTGRVPLYAMRVTVEGPFDATQATRFIGNLAAQRQITFDGQFRPLEEGLQEGAVVIFGEDVTGTVVEYRHPFVIDVGGGFAWEGGGGMSGGTWSGEEVFMPGMPGMPGEFPMDGMDGEGEGGGFLGFAARPVFWIPAASALALGIVVAAVLIRRRRNRLLFEEDEG